MGKTQTLQRWEIPMRQRVLFLTRLLHKEAGGVYNISVYGQRTFTKSMVSQPIFFVEQDTLDVALRSLLWSARIPERLRPL